MILTQPGRRGFTLIELLIVIVIIAVLVSLIIPALNTVRRNSRNAATKALIQNVATSLENYRLEWGLYPIKEGKTGKIFDSGSGQFDPGYFQTKCVAMGAETDKTEDNKELNKMLRSLGYLQVNQKNLDDQQYQLIDSFGTPLIIRFMILNPQAENARGAVNRTPRLMEKVYCWSYGSDKKNHVEAQPDYENKGQPDYDREEVKSMEESPEKEKDDITSWKN